MIVLGWAFEQNRIAMSRREERSEAGAAAGGGQIARDLPRNKAKTSESLEWIEDGRGVRPHRGDQHAFGRNTAVSTRHQRLVRRLADARARPALVFAGTVVLTADDACAADMSNSGDRRRSMTGIGVSESPGTVTSPR